MDEITTPRPQNAVVKYYKPSELLGMFTSYLSQQDVNRQVIYLQGIYLKNPKHDPRWTSRYDILRDVFSCISCIGRQTFYYCATREAPCGGYTCPLYAGTVTGQQVWKCQKETEHTTTCFVAEHFEAAVSPGTTSPSVPISLCPCGAPRRVPTNERSAAPPGPDLSLSLT